jgi:hypothetical protein
VSHDTPDDPGVTSPGLRVLLRSLARAATPAELDGEEAAVAMFRALRP